MSAKAALLFFALATLAAAQSTGPTYQYFAETGFGGNLEGLTSTTGFGLRFGTSQFFWVTDVDTSIKPLVTSSSTIRTGAEYHAAISGKTEFLGYMAGGVTVNTATTSTADATAQTSIVGLGNFQGGFGLSYDIGSVLSKGKFSLPMVAQFRITAISGNSVKTSYFLMFRKTF